MVIGLVVACTLTACATPADPADPPTTTPPTSAAPSPTQTPTPTPTPDAATPPERPDMSTVDAETAEAVAVYFLELYPYVYATGDLTEWRALSHPECIFCASVITNVEEMVAKGEHWEGGSWTIAAVDLVARTNTGFDLRLETTEEPATRMSGSGEVLETTSGGPGVARMVVVTEGDHLLVRATEID